MKMMKGMTVALAGLMATGALAAATDTAATAATAKKKKIIQKKAISRKGAVTRKEAKEDHLTTPQSSALSAANATTSMPALTAGTSAMEAPKAMKKKTFVDNIRAGVLFEYYGGSLSEPFSGWQTDKDSGFAQGGASHELDTRLTLGYAVSSNLTISANGYFWSYSDSPDGSSAGETFGFRPADSFIRFNVGKFYQAGNFKWSGDFRYYPGFGTAYPDRQFYLRTGQNFSYAVTPRLSLVAYNQIRYYQNDKNAYNSSNDKRGDRVDMMYLIGPGVEYQALDTVGFSLTFNDAYAHAHQQNILGSAKELKHDYAWGPYFEAGASIDVTKFMNVNPYVDMYTHTFNVEAMQLGANVNFTIL